MEKTPLVALLTDFGLQDPFVGIMKGVMANIAPGIRMVDLTHEIPPGDILRGALSLWQARPFFPSHTVFLCVVDPGVGTSRRPLLVQSGGYTFVGPDNGLFTFILNEEFRAWQLQNPSFALPNPGSTFHGRDIFAPAAAFAASGVPGAEFGPEVEDLALLPAPRLEVSLNGSVRGEILYPDRYGNLLTSLGKFERLDRTSFRLNPWVKAAFEPGASLIFYIGESHAQLPDGKILKWVNTFDEVPPGEVAVLVGSSGLLEIVARNQSAADLLRSPFGASITIQR